MKNKRARKPPPLEGGIEGIFADLEKDILSLQNQEQFDRESPLYSRQLKTLLEKRMNHTLRTLRATLSDRERVLLFAFERPQIKRRTAAALRYMPEVVSRFAGDYPKLNMELEFISLNTIPTWHVYDLEERASRLSVAAALYILDDLAQSGHLSAAAIYLPEKEDFCGKPILPEGFRDSRYDDSLVRSLAWLIKNRNAETARRSAAGRFLDQDAAKRTGADLGAAVLPEGTPYVRFASMDYRSRLDAVLSMVSPAATERAARQFEEKVWELFGLFLPHLSRCREELLRENSRLQKLFDEVKELRDRKRAVAPLPPVLAPASLPNPLEARFTPDSTDYLLGIAKQISEKYGQCLDLSAREDRIRMAWAGITGMDSEQEDTPQDRAIREQLDSFSVDDPYETCFALLWLLDTGSDLPWLVTLGSGVVAAAAQQLPWTQAKICVQNGSEDTKFTEKPQASEHMDHIANTAELQCAENPEHTGDAGGEPEKRTASGAALYRREYTDPSSQTEVETDPAEQNCRWNLPQLVYACTGMVMPRCKDGYDGFSGKLAASGIPPETAEALELYLQLAGCRQYRYDDLRPEVPDAWDSRQEESQAEPSADMDALQEQIRHQKKELRRLREALSASERTAAEEQRLRTEAEGEHTAEHQELIGLRELVYRLNSGEPEEAPSERDAVPLPYRTTHRFVVFGGHATWLKAIQPMLPDVRFVSLDMIPNANLIRHADMVWVQTNAIAHKHFNKIVDTIRTHRIPLRYFGYASAEKCARQLAEVDLQEFNQ